MHPILFQFHDLTFYSYGFAVAVAMFLSLAVAQARAPKSGLSRELVADLLFVLFISGIIGARLAFVVQHWEEFQGHPAAVIRLQEGGLVWYGGLFGALAAGVVYARWRKWPVLKLADFFAPLSAMAHGIGRIGCFFNGCCYGRRTDSWLGVHFPDDVYAKLPTQLYEAAGLFAIAAFLFLYSSKPRRAGSVLWMYLAAYAVLRFFIEFLRGDNAHYFSWTLPQWMSVALGVSALFMLKKVRG